MEYPVIRWQTRRRTKPGDLKGGQFPGWYLNFHVRMPLAIGFEFTERLQVEFEELVMGDPSFSSPVLCCGLNCSHTHPQVLSEPLPHMPVTISGNKVLVEVTML